MKKGKAQGYLAEAEIREHLPKEIIVPEQIEDIFKMIEDMGVKIVRHNDP